MSANEEATRALFEPDWGCPPSLVTPEATREKCIRCGMVANVDPSLHTERYGHVPEVIRGLGTSARRLRFSFETYAFTEETE